RCHWRTGLRPSHRLCETGHALGRGQAVSLYRNGSSSALERKSGVSRSSYSRSSYMKQISLGGARLEAVRSCMLKETYPMYLGGKPVSPNFDLEVRNVFTGRVASRVSLASAEVVDAAIAGCVEASEAMT